MAIDKQQVARQFSRAAPRYDSQAGLQQRMADQVIANLTDQATGHVVDLGCGTGETLQKLAQSERALALTKFTGIDFAPGMIEVARRRSVDATWLCEDLEQTSLPSGCADVVISNAALQWCQLENALREISRLLTRPGYLVASTFGPRTLEQLQLAWQQVDPEKQHVHDFESADSIRMALTRLGFAAVTIDRQIEQLEFESPESLLASVRGLGATYADRERGQGSLTRRMLADLKQAIRETAKLGDPILLTYECLFMTAFKPTH